MRVTPVTTAAGLFTVCAIGAATAALVAHPWSPDVPPLHRVAVAITEDDPGWNCLTMGNRECGPGYRTIPFALAVSLSLQDGQDWGACLAEITPARTTVVCPDGRVATS